MILLLAPYVPTLRHGRRVGFRPACAALIALLGVACAPTDDDDYPFDKIEDGKDDTAADTDTGDTDTGGDTGPDTDVDAFVLAFEGTVVTVSGTPLGFDDTIRETRITGAFTWNRALEDSEESTERGLYDHHGSGALTLTVMSRVLVGSGSPQVEVENFDSNDTFRFVDGSSIFPTDRDRTMKLDGVEDPELGVWFAVTDGEGAVFSSDDMPAAWPYGDIATYPHTFSVEDAGGTLLLQLDQAGPG